MNKPQRKFFRLGAQWAVALHAFGFALVLRGAEEPSLELPAVLTFSNGDRVEGELESMNSQGQLIWKHPSWFSPAILETASIEEIRWRWRDELDLSFSREGRCLVELAGDDRLPGNLVEMDGERLVLDTEYAGRLTLPRKKIRSIVPLPPPGIMVYSGFNQFEGWTLGEVNIPGVDGGRWEWRRGAALASNAASLAKNLHLPDRCSIRMDMEWRGALNLAIALYTDYMHPISLANKDQEPAFEGFYSLQVRSFGVALLPVKKEEPLQYIGQASIPLLSQTNRVNLEIRVDKPKKTIHLMMNDKLLQTWIDQDGFAGGGRGVRFVHQGQGLVKLSQFQVREWDGLFETQAAQPPGNGLDLAKLHSGGQSVGKVLSVSPQIMKMNLEGEDQDIAWNTVEYLTLSSSEGAPAKSEGSNSSWLAEFRSEGVVELNILEWGADQIKAHNPSAGDLTLKPEFFSRFYRKPSPTPTGSPR